MTEINTSSTIGEFLSEVDVASNHGAKRVVVDELNDEKVSWHIETGKQRLARWFGSRHNARAQNTQFIQAVKQLSAKAQNTGGEGRPLLARTVNLLNETPPSASSFRTVVKSLLTSLQRQEISIPGLRAETAQREALDPVVQGGPETQGNPERQPELSLEDRANSAFRLVTQHRDIQPSLGQFTGQIEELNGLIPHLRAAIDAGNGDAIAALVERANGLINTISTALGRDNTNQLTTEAALAALTPLREFFSSVLPEEREAQSAPRRPEARPRHEGGERVANPRPRPDGVEAPVQQSGQTEIPPGKLNRENIRFDASDLPSLIHQLDRALVSPTQRLFVDRWDPNRGVLEFRVLSEAKFAEASAKRGPQTAPDYDNVAFKEALGRFTGDAVRRGQVSEQTAQTLRNATDGNTHRSDYIHNTQAILQLSETASGASLWADFKAIEGDRFKLPEPDYRKLSQYHPKVAAQAAHARARQAEVLNRLADDDPTKSAFLSVSERIERHLNAIQNATPPKSAAELAEFRVKTEEGILQLLSSVQQPGTRLLMQSALSDLYGLMVMATTPGMRESSERLLRPGDVPLSPRAYDTIAAHRANLPPIELQHFEQMQRGELDRLRTINASATNTVRVLKTQIDDTDARLDVVIQRLQRDQLDATSRAALTEQYTWLTSHRQALQQGLQRQLADVSGALLEHTLRVASSERTQSAALNQAIYALNQSYANHRLYSGPDVDYRDALQYLKTFDGLINGEFYTFRSDSDPNTYALLDPAQASASLRVANVVSSAYTQLEDIAQIMAEPAATSSDLSHQQTQQMAQFAQEAQRLQSALQQLQSSQGLTYEHFLQFQRELHQLTMRFESALGGAQRARVVAADSTVVPVQRVLHSLHSVTTQLAVASAAFGGARNNEINLPSITKPTVSTHNQSVQTPALPQFYGKSQLNGNCWIAAINAVFGEEVFPYADVQNLLRERFKAEVVRNIPAGDSGAFRRYLADQFHAQTGENRAQVERELVDNPDRVLDTLALFKARDDIAQQLAWNYQQKNYPNAMYMARQITAQMSWADVAFHLGGTQEDAIIKNIATGYKLASNPAEPATMSELRLAPQDGTHGTLQYRRQQVAQFLADKDRVYLGRDGHATALRKTQDGRWYHIDSNNYYENTGLSAGAREVDPVEFLARESRNAYPAIIYGLPPLAQPQR